MKCRSFDTCTETFSQQNEKEHGLVLRNANSSRLYLSTNSHFATLRVFTGSFDSDKNLQKEVKQHTEGQ